MEKKIRIKVSNIPTYLTPVIAELSSIKVENEYVKVIPYSLIVKEAIARGLRAMLMEKRYLEISEKERKLI